MTFDTTITETVEHLNGRFAKELKKAAKEAGADDIQQVAQSRRELGKIKLILRFRPRDGENIAEQRLRAMNAVCDVDQLNTELRRKEIEL